MWQTIIVVLIVGGAVFFVGRNFLRKLTRNEVPACGSCEDGCAAVPELDSLDCQSFGDGSVNENEDKSQSRLVNLSH
ncbi:MAG: FeoB-associated Cys-rich membrane protein [Candidatus Adiutricales bacterium]